MINVMGSHRAHLTEKDGQSILKNVWKALYYRVPVSPEQTQALMTISSLIKHR